MKQESVISKCLVIIVLLSISHFKCLAQTNNKDSFQDTTIINSVDMTLLYNYLESEFDVKQYIFETYTPQQSTYTKQFSIEKFRLPKINQQIIFDQSPLHRGEFNTGGILHQFNQSSILLGSGTRTNLIGLGEINNATISYYHQVNNRLVIGGYVGASTLRAPHQSSDQFEVGSNLSYLITKGVIFHAFGNYSFGKPHPALGTLYSTSSFGGYFAIDMSERFGMGFGGQTYYNTSTNKWEAAPIIMPYFKVNDKVSVQLDLGGILLESIKQIIHNKQVSNIKNNPNNGTIAPPKMNIPIREHW